MLYGTLSPSSVVALQFTQLEYIDFELPLLEDIRVPGYEVTGNVALYEVRGSEVSQPQHQVVAPVLGCAVLAA